MNHTAPAGQVWVCGACGKRSRDLYGEVDAMYGWDESCVMNAVLCYEKEHSDDRWVSVIGPECL